MIAAITYARGLAYAISTINTNDGTTIIEARAAAAFITAYIDYAIIVMRPNHFYFVDSHDPRLLEYNNWTLSHVWDCINVMAHISTQSEVIHGMLNVLTS